MDSSPHAVRRTGLRERLLREGHTAYLVTRLPNVRWLTGFTGSNGQVLLGAEPERDLFATDGRYDEQAAQEVPDLPRVLGREDDWLPGRLRRGDRLAVESHDLTWDRARALERVLAEHGVIVVPAPSWVELLREVKDDAEIATLRRACALADAAFADLLTWLRPGLTERRIAHRLEDHMRAAGADGPSFESIVASGPNSARPHHHPTDRALGAGELLKLDFGALVDGYHSDMTRTVAVGEPGQELRAVHKLVRAAQEAGRAAAVAGASAADVDAACRTRIIEAGHGERFVHPTGHAVGLEIHEQPILHAGATATLRPGMAVTVEPGVYLPGLGGVRIEDVVVVAAEGPPEVLTTSPRELIVL